MAKKLTWMVLEVDLDCSDCYKDVKKILAKFRDQIRDQTFHMQKNEVRITVDCSRSSPEEIRDKLRSKGGKVINSIHIIEQPNPTKPPDKLTAAAPPKNPKPAIPPGGGAALGVPVPRNHYPFPSGFGCPQCGYPCCHGYGKVLPPPAPNNI